ncbi:MAG: cupredoxin family copper-binding protein [Vulcanimicrobiaceae bacterium]
MHRFLVGAGGLAFSLALAGVPGSAAETTAAALLPSVLTVHIKDFAYNPTPAKIHAGDRVTFINDDDEAHTVTADDKSFDSEGLDGAGTWQHVFLKPGTYHYFCELHPYMKATIVVLPSSGAQR